jgi:hypothetical protein
MVVDHTNTKPLHCSSPHTHRQARCGSQAITGLRHMINTANGSSSVISILPTPRLGGPIAVGRERKTLPRSAGRVTGKMIGNGLR